MNLMHEYCNQIIWLAEWNNSIVLFSQAIVTLFVAVVLFLGGGVSNAGKKPEVVTDVRQNSQIVTREWNR